MIAGHAGISVVAARQALIAHEENGTTTRIKGGKPGVPDDRKPAAGPDSPAPPAEAPAWDTPAAGGQPASVVGTAEGGEPEAVAAPDPDPAVTAEASGNVLAVAQAADEAGKALAAGNLPAALAALDAVREQAAQGRRALKAAASGRHAPATRPGALRDLVEQHLRTFPDATFTPHQIGKVLTLSAGAVANALDKLTGLGTAELASDKPRSYRLAPAPAPDAVGDPGTSAEAAPSAV